ncbi:hypothetical protein BH09MYX1_BH09MYX1_48280 [soil metagenome]
MRYAERDLDEPTKAKPPATVGRRKWLLGAAAVASFGAVFFLARRPFPSEKTPEGAYARIAKAIAEDHPLGVFPFLETDAQWACFTLRDQRKRALDRVEASYPRGLERDRLVAEYEKDGRLPDGSDVFVRWAKEKGWFARLRRDLSGTASVEQDGERATVVTARGSRYNFRVRENGIWGLTMFTAELVVEAEKASRDLDVVNRAADDYEKSQKK